MILVVEAGECRNVGVKIYLRKWTRIRVNGRAVKV
jgi:hypothetical protein